MLLVLTLPLWMSSLASAATQEDVFKSISSNVDQPTSGGRVLAVILGIAAVFAILVVLQQRFKREASPKPVNHHGKLMKEILKDVPLKPADVKRLKTLAEQRGCNSPLTLLLCPSILAETIKKKN